MIEILQNIFNHSEDFRVVDHQSFKYSLSKRGTDYFITTSNFIKTANVKELVEKLNTYLALNDSDLTKTYRKTLNNGDFSTITILPARFMAWLIIVFRSLILYQIKVLNIQVTILVTLSHEEHLSGDMLFYTR